jgi:hypothetical protein
MDVSQHKRRNALSAGILAGTAGLLFDQSGTLSHGTAGVWKCDKFSTCSVFIWSFFSFLLDRGKSISARRAWRIAVTLLNA